MTNTEQEPLTKFYVTCGDARLVIQEHTTTLAAMELVIRSLDKPNGMQLGPLVMVSQQGFRTPDDMDSQTAIFSFFTVLTLLGHKFRPGGRMDQIFRRSEHDQDENEE